MFQDKTIISITVLPSSLTEHQQFFKKMCFICNDKRITDNNTYNEISTEPCEFDYAKEHLTESSTHYECDKSSWFYETLRRFNIFHNR